MEVVNKRTGSESTDRNRIKELCCGLLDVLDIHGSNERPTGGKRAIHVVPLLHSKDTKFEYIGFYGKEASQEVRREI